ncbi:MAG: hypothetical protein ACC661_08115, partial [Verrucomicrobiales bacterium]
MKKLITIAGICSAVALAMAVSALAGPDGAGQGRGKGEGKGGPGGPGGKGGHRPSPEKIIERLDTDNSGTVSLAEFQAGP